MIIFKYLLIGLGFCITINLVSCSKVDSPIATLNNISSAIVKKDIEEFKKNISTSYLVNIEKLASHRKISIDEYIGKYIFDSPPKFNIPIKTRGESIDGNKATVWIYLKNNNWTQVFFIKEDGEWKISGSD